MADTTEAPVLNIGTVPQKLEVTRDGKSWTFTQAKLKKKDKTAADRFALVPARPKTDAEYVAFLDFLNPKQAALVAYARLRGMAANWTNSAVNKAGEFNQDMFNKMVEDMSARGETLKALRDELAELTNEIISLSKNTAMSPVDKVARMNEIGTRLNEINETIAWKQAENKEDEEVEVEGAPA